MGRKKVLGEHRHYGFRMPQEHFDLLSQVARAKGIDLAALLNQIVTDAIPDLREWLFRHAIFALGTEMESRVLGALVPHDHFDDVVSILGVMHTRDPADQDVAVARAVKMAVKKKKGGRNLEERFFDWIRAVLAVRTAIEEMREEAKENDDEGQGRKKVEEPQAPGPG